MPPKKKKTAIKKLSTLDKEAVRSVGKARRLMGRIGVDDPNKATLDDVKKMAEFARDYVEGIEEDWATDIDRFHQAGMVLGSHINQEGYDAIVESGAIEHFPALLRDPLEEVYGHKTMVDRIIIKSAESTPKKSATKPKHKTAIRHKGKARVDPDSDIGAWLSDDSDSDDDSLMRTPQSSTSSRRGTPFEKIRINEIPDNELIGEPESLLFDPMEKATPRKVGTRPTRKTAAKAKSSWLQEDDEGDFIKFPGYKKRNK